MIKQCKICKQFLPIDSFYTNRPSKDGHLNRCKKCFLEQMRQYRLLNKEYYSEYEKKRAKTEKRKKLAKILSKKYRKQYPERKRAQQQAERALKKGILEKPEYCVMCNKKERLYVLHIDYNQPLNVLFLCCSCHNKIHHNKKYFMIYPQIKKTML